MKNLKIFAKTVDPQAYKPMEEILDCISDTVQVLKIIRPIYHFKAGD